jgi:hypothetical protein
MGPEFHRVVSPRVTASRSPVRLSRSLVDAFDLNIGKLRQKVLSR